MNALIIPVYKNEESIPDLLEAVVTLSKNSPEPFMATFVVDGSPDRCYDLLKQLLPGQPFKSKLVLHSRNFGSFAAIKTGLVRSVADRYAVMAADLQEPLELVTEIFTTLNRNESDVVIASRTGRNDPLLTRLFSKIFWEVYRKYVNKEIPHGGVDIFGCNRKVRDVLADFRESNSSLIGQLFWIGFRRKTLQYSRLVRKKGTSAWTVRKKINYFMDSVFAFTDLPIKLLLSLGFTGAILSLVFSAIVVIIKLLGKMPVPGYTATIMTIIFFGTINIFALGIIGTYVHRSYENSKGRPQSLIDDDTDFEGKNQ
jgi:polyisoprenyl-phosphate glycosyltransferase